MSDPITIILVDDHVLVRDGVRAYLVTQPDLQVIGEAGSGEAAIALVERLIPDVVLMDLSMPGMSGVAATQQIRAISPHTQVVILTSFHEDGDIFPALRAGAISYLLKDTGPQEVAAAIRAAVQQEAVVHPRVAARLVHNVQGGAPGASLFALLTDREQAVLRLIAEGQTNAAIAAQLVISDKTVKGHVSNILSKLQLEDRTQAAVIAWREGFMNHRT
jgi:two-component system, NarL family, response regulator LiaR